MFNLFSQKLSSNIKRYVHYVHIDLQICSHFSVKEINKLSEEVDAATSGENYELL